MDSTTNLEHDLVHLAQVAIEGQPHEAQAWVRKLARRYRTSSPELAGSLVKLLRDSPLRGGAARMVSQGEPLDGDSRLPLVRRETSSSFSVEPILPDSLKKTVEQLVCEHRQSDKLLRAGLDPTRTALFVGPPGTGKTLTAHWISNQLDLPLATLDLASVMSSFLGKTGSNVRRVLDYAKSVPCVLLVDELDAVAKRRDDATEIGELKRLVTVLLQEIDNWPAGSLLLAATNHSELLDPAIWRRFEVVVEFGNPEKSAIRAAIIRYLDGDSVPDDVLELSSTVYLGESLSRVERDIMRARRQAALLSLPLEDSLLELARGRIASVAPQVRGPMVANLVAHGGLSQRRVSQLTGVSRDTIRKYMAVSDRTGS